MSNPYSKKERSIQDHLVKAWSLFVELEKTHPSHNSDFADGIHKCQDILIHRIVQRDYPDSFPTHTQSNKDVTKIKTRPFDPLTCEVCGDTHSKK